MTTKAISSTDEKKQNQVISPTKKPANANDTSDFDELIKNNPFQDEEIDPSTQDYGYGYEPQETAPQPQSSTVVRKGRVGRRASVSGTMPSKELEPRRQEATRRNSQGEKPRRPSLLPPQELDAVFDSYNAIMAMDGESANTGW